MLLQSDTAERLLEADKLRLIASVLLLGYFIIAAVLAPRELNFLRGVEEAQYRRSFIAQDILIQLAVLLVLIPCVAVPGLLSQEFWPYTVIMSGMALLWGSWLWAAISRYAYTYRILHKSTREFERRHNEMLEGMIKEKKVNDR